MMNGDFEPHHTSADIAVQIVVHGVVKGLPHFVGSSSQKLLVVFHVPDRSFPNTHRPFLPVGIVLAPDSFQFEGPRSIFHKTDIRSYSLLGGPSDPGNSYSGKLCVVSISNVLPLQQLPTKST